MSELLASVDIRHMHLYIRDADAGDSVAQSVAVVGQRSGVDNGSAVNLPRLMYLINKVALVV